MSKLSEAADAKEIARECYRDPVLFCKYFLPHLFPGRIPWVHRGIWAILTRQTDFLWDYGEVDKIVKNFVTKMPDGTTKAIFSIDGDNIKMDLGRYTLIMLARGFSKTTLAGVANSLRKILYQETEFFAYVSEAGPHAIKQLDNIKREIESNVQIKAVFGELKPEMRDPQKWTADFFETVTGCAMAARGRGGQIRGLNHRGRRPGQIVVDDAEDKESVSTDEQREKVRSWAYGDLMPALPELDPNASIVALGTMLHPDCLMETWARDPEWTTIKLGIIDSDGDYIWPENMDEAKDIRKKASYALAGELHTYYMEYHSKVRAPEKQKFRPEFFIYDQPSVPLRVAVSCDPAISPKKKADFSAVAAVGMSEKGIIYILDMWLKRGATPRELVDKFFEFSSKYSAQQHGIESIQYQAALIHLCTEEMFRKNRYFEIVPITHNQQKETRIEGVLQPRYASGYIKHTRHFPELETQLLDWPLGKKDAADAAAMAITLLDPFAPDAAGIDLGLDEYKPLDEELATIDKEYEKLLSDFRSAP